MNTNKIKHKENVKKEMPKVNQSTKFDSEGSKENQSPEKFSHKSSKEETYEPKKNKVPRSKT